jgi:hypothetical protein
MAGGGGSRGLLSAAMTRYRIAREDGRSDAIAGKSFASYNEAYAVLERYYSDLCCSDDREYYRITEDPAGDKQAPLSEV